MPFNKISTTHFPTPILPPINTKEKNLETTHNDVYCYTTNDDNGKIDNNNYCNSRIYVISNDYILQKDEVEILSGVLRKDFQLGGKGIFEKIKTKKWKNIKIT